MRGREPFLKKGSPSPGPPPFPRLSCGSQPSLRMQTFPGKGRSAFGQESPFGGKKLREKEFGKRKGSLWGESPPDRKTLRGQKSPSGGKGPPSGTGPSRNRRDFGKGKGLRAGSGSRKKSGSPFRRNRLSMERLFGDSGRVESLPAECFRQWRRPPSCGRGEGLHGAMTRTSDMPKGHEAEATQWMN